MKKNSILQENIFATLAKMIAAFQIQKKIGGAMDKIPDDPDIKKAFKDMIDADERARRSLKMFCIRNPDDPKCIDKNGEK